MAHIAPRNKLTSLNNLSENKFSFSESELIRLIYRFTYKEVDIEKINEELRKIDKIYNATSDLKPGDILYELGGHGGFDVEYYAITVIGDIDPYSGSFTGLEKGDMHAKNKTYYVEDLRFTIL